MISEDVNIRDAEHGVSPILLRCSRVPVICEWRPEAAAEAAPKLQWPRCSIQCKDASPCLSPLFLYMLLFIRSLKREKWRLELQWVKQKRISKEFFQKIKTDTPVFN